MLARALVALLVAGGLLWVGLRPGRPDEPRAQVLCPTQPASSAVREGDAESWRFVAPSIALLKDRRYGEAFSGFEEAARQMGSNPVALMTDALEHLGPEQQRDGARWLGAWARRNAADRAASVCAAALFVSEYDSPRRAVALMERVHAMHPGEFLPAATLATVLVHQVGMDEVPASDRERQLARAEALVAEAAENAGTPEDARDAQLLEVDLLAFRGRTAEALDLYERISSTGVSIRDVAERQWEAAILSLKLGDPSGAADYLAQTLEATKKLATEDTERLTPPAALALVTRHVLLGQPVQEREVAELEASFARVRQRGFEPAGASAPLLELPRLALEVHEGEPARVRKVLKRLEELERRYGPQGAPLACLTWLTHYQPVTAALTHGLRSEAYERLGDEEAAAHHARLFHEQFPQPAAVSR